MTQIADQLRQKMKGLVKYPTNFSSSPKSSRSNSSLHTSTSSGQISIFSKSAVLREQLSSNNALKHQSSPNLSSYHAELNAEEIQILAKIEEQNRLLEADRKSVSSEGVEGHSGISHQNSYRSVSPTSISSHSNGSNESESENNSDYSNRTWILWGRIVNDWEDYKKRNGKQLREIIRCGIPHHFRGLVWQLLCNAHNSTNKRTYAELIRQSSPSEKIIRRDIARTYPEQDFFKEKDGFGQEVLFNVIKAYSLVDREVGYCQGSAFIVGLLLMQMPEEEAFAVFVALMQEYRLRELFKPSMAELGLCMYQLENMLQDHSPELMTHFTAQAIHLSMFASSWFLTLFATFFDLNLASRIMDVFMSEGMEIIFRIGLALLLSSQSKLMELDMEGMLKLIQKELTVYYNNEPNLLFQRAYSLVKYNTKKMKKLEKEYMSMKEREQEEQIEMRRLRTENTLLRQRIECLESENGVLADKLIEDRVSRALEAEEKIIMGKELSIAKRQAMLGRSSPSDVHERACEEKTTGNAKSFAERLQQELAQSKLREAEATSSIAELQGRLRDLTEANRELVDQSKVTSLQDELAAAKLREAECDGAMKELSHKLRMLEESWQKQMARTNTTRRASSLHSKSGRKSKAALQEVQEELLSAKFRETKLIAQMADVNQKLLELETVNHICTDQLRRSEESRCLLTGKLRVSADCEKACKQELVEAKAQIADLESKNQEVIETLRLKEADAAEKITRLEQVINVFNFKKCENTDSLSTPSDDSAKVIDQLQKKLAEQQCLMDQLRGQTTDSDVNLTSINENEGSPDMKEVAELPLSFSIRTKPALDPSTIPRESLESTTMSD